uniref:GP-PDE domain-containing protein n=1 Tax=Denticeps clupeoides TaxID=299321 RepID=A0AAY4D612_9TELE
MVRHQPLQVYERQLCLSCLTGIYGCRWKRYQRSHDDTTKWECLWSFILFCTFCLLLVWFYFWLVAHNDYNEIPVPLNLHWLHKIGVTAALLTTIVGVISVSQMWGEEWDVIRMSLQATGPFLHIGALVAVTGLAWLVAGQVARAEKTRFQVLLVLIYLFVLLTLYLVPLSITSPCIMERNLLKRRPQIFGYQGAPMLAPENTALSFQRALSLNISGLEAHVTVSFDGVPFLMRDRTLRRTTNVQKVFPEQQLDDASFFNWTDLLRLNAGQWFLRDDPFWTVQSLPTKDLRQIRNQSVCSLERMLHLAVSSDSSVLLTLRRPPPDHPHHHSWINDTLDTIRLSGIPQHAVMWVEDRDRQLVRRVAPGFQQTSTKKQPAPALHQQGVSRLLLRYNQLSGQDLREFSSSNISTTVYRVNELWLYSLLWCAGVTSVSSEAPHILRKLHSPSWLMSPEQYGLIWITADLVSFALVLAIFIFQNFHMIRWRMSGMHSYNPEQIMLSAAVRRSSREVNIMKEKLIFSGKCVCEKE